MFGSNRFCRYGGYRKSSAPRRWVVRPPTDADRRAWEHLFAGYCDFYERPSTPAGRERVWEWIESGTIRCLLAVPAGAADGDAIGMAHLRPCPSPLRGAVTGYLDDLFVTPSARGSGAFEALVEAIRGLAGEEGWKTIRWITAADNARARAAYERVAERTGWITYQLDI